MLYQDVRLILMYVVTFLFSVVIVNLVIAVYSNEYECVELRSPLYFMKNRAHMNVHYYFQQQVWDCLKLRRGTERISRVSMNPILLKVGTTILIGLSILNWIFLCLWD